MGFGGHLIWMSMTDARVYTYSRHVSACSPHKSNLPTFLLNFSGIVHRRHPPISQYSTLKRYIAGGEKPVRQAWVHTPH